MLARRFATAVSSAPLHRVAARRALATAAAAERIVFTSPHTSLDIPDKTIWEIAHERATDSGDRNAFICGLEHTKLTFAELHESAGRLALALAQDGVRKGDAVMVHSFNTIEYPIVVLALTALGAVCSPSPPMFLATELARQAKAANANYIITHADLKDVAIEAADKVGIQRKHIYTVGATSVPNLKSVNELIQREMGAFDFEKIDPDSNVLLPFSSGTTGAPKARAAPSLARNMVANAVQVHHVQDLGDHSLGLLPFYHIYAMMLMHLSIYQGAAKVVLPRFEPHTFLNALSTYKIRAAHVAPPIALFLANHPMVKDYDISATEFLVSGGAPMGKEVENLVKARLGVGVKQAYGMTEASPAVNYTEDAFHKPFIDAIPKSPTGKILRRQLQEIENNKFAS
ncbi:hypothetical protein PybrP1_007946 [[Pythium] brassicae (nom. inval.)]|nr:hypothetical protein PybrP1_007946 [[Pythium] brassicae (nom. inval.)]